MMIRSLLLILSILVFNACTSKVDEGLTAAPSVTVKQGCEGKACAVCELPWGGSLNPGESTEESYSKSLVECTESCSAFKVKLTCVEGKLEAKDATGKPFLLLSALTRACHVKRCDCNFGGTVVEDGKTRDFFKMSAPSCGRVCEPRNFTCKSGKLVDTAAPAQPSTISSFPNAACTPVACKNCTAPWGAQVLHEATIPAFKADVSGCTSTCAANKATLKCTDGIFSGGDTSLFKFAACTDRACQNCTLPSGDILAHNSTSLTYQISTAPCGTTCSANQASLKCVDGTITGGDPLKYKYNSCTAVACLNCTLPCGTTLGSGGEGYCFSKASPTACGNTCLADRKRFTCLNGVTTAEDGTAGSANTAFSFKTCNEGAACSACTLPDGRKVIDGTKATFYKQDKMGCGQTCMTTANAITLTCSNGVFANQALYSAFTKTSCEVDCRTVDGDLGIGRVAGDGGGAPVIWCQIPWSGTWATHNSNVTAYSVAKPPVGQKCSAYKTQIVCNAYRGLWSGGGTYVYGMCKE